MAERRVLPSHPDYEKLNELSTLMALASNPHLARPETLDIPEKSVEMEAIKQVVSDALAQGLEVGRFADLINSDTFKID